MWKISYKFKTQENRNSSKDTTRIRWLYGADHCLTIHACNENHTLNWTDPLRLGEILCISSSNNVDITCWITLGGDAKLTVQCLCRDGRSVDDCLLLLWIRSIESDCMICNDVWWLPFVTILVRVSHICNFPICEYDYQCFFLPLSLLSEEFFLQKYNRNITEII